jgi:hypothetical protein
VSVPPRFVVCVLAVFALERFAFSAVLTAHTTVLHDRGSDELAVSAISASLRWGGRSDGAVRAVCDILGPARCRAGRVAHGRDSQRVCLSRNRGGSEVVVDGRTSVLNSGLSSYCWCPPRTRCGLRTIAAWISVGRTWAGIALTLALATLVVLAPARLLPSLGVGTLTLVVTAVSFTGLRLLRRASRSSPQRAWPRSRWVPSPMPCPSR